MIDIGKLTAEQTAELLTACLYELQDDEALARIAEWARADASRSDELVAALQEQEHANRN